jgi:predicted nucleotide-binding protein (sugar kinase/HSP70/actin superfamily)
MHKLVLKYVGAENVPVVSPNQDGSFYREFTQNVNGSAMRSFMKDIWIATVGIDLLHKLLLKMRPVAVEPHHAQQIYQEALLQWLGAVENRTGLAKMKRLMTSIAERFNSVKCEPVKSTHKPKVGIVGEIYVRSHPFANMNVIARLEALGAVCDLAPLAEWVYYTNFTRKKASLRSRNLKDFFTDAAIDYMQHKIEKILAKPLEKYFGPLAEEPVEHVIRLAAPYMHQSFEGEAILSIGKMVEYYHKGFSGVVNVMPFSCMPSTVVSGCSMRVSSDCSGMPILNLSFDGQEDAALTTRLEAFVEQLGQRKVGGLEAARVASQKK